MNVTHALKTGWRRNQSVHGKSLPRLGVVKQHEIRAQHLAALCVLPLAANGSSQSVPLQDRPVADVPHTVRADNLWKYQRRLAPVDAAALAVRPQLESRLDRLAIGRPRIGRHVWVMGMQGFAFCDLLSAKLNDHLRQFRSRRNDYHVFPAPGQDDIQRNPF